MAYVEGSFWIIKSLWIVYNFDMMNLQYCFIHVLVLILLYWSLTGGQALGLGSTLYRSDLWTLHSDRADRGKWHRGPSLTLNTCPSSIMWHPLSPVSLFIEQGQISHTFVWDGMDFLSFIAVTFNVFCHCDNRLFLNNIYLNVNYNIFCSKYPSKEIYEIIS